jgi:hypothetical protein
LPETTGVLPFLQKGTTARTECREGRSTISRSSPSLLRKVRLSRPRTQTRSSSWQAATGGLKSVISHEAVTQAACSGHEEPRSRRRREATVLPTRLWSAACISVKGLLS